MLLISVLVANMSKKIKLLGVVVKFSTKHSIVLFVVAHDDVLP